MFKTLSRSSSEKLFLEDKIWSDSDLYLALSEGGWEIFGKRHSNKGVIRELSPGIIRAFVFFSTV